MAKSYIGSTGIKKIFNLIKNKISIIGYEEYITDLLANTFKGKMWSTAIELNGLPYGVYLAIGSFGLKNWEGYFTITFDKGGLRDSMYIPFSSINNLSCCVMQLMYISSNNSSIKLYIFPSGDISESNGPFGEIQVIRIK